MHNEFEAPLEPCLENFLDVPHTVFVHPGLFRSEGVRRPTRIVVRRDQGGVEAEFQDEVPLEGWGPRLLFPNRRMSFRKAVQTKSVPGDM